MSEYIDPDEGFRNDVARRAAQMSVEKEARRIVAAGDFTPPPSDMTSTLAADLRRPVEPIRHRVESLVGVRHNATLTGAYKTGKTTLFGNLAKSLVDGTPFLGSLATIPARVAFWNGEMDREDFTDYMRHLGFVHPERMAVYHLRGYRISLLSDAGREHAIRWLNDHGSEVWLEDSWARLCAWAGVNGNDNAAVADLCASIDEIKTATQVDTFIPTVHTGRAQHAEGSEHGRGATYLDDWADSRLVMTRSGKDRFLYAEGRRVGLDETRLDFDPGTGLMTLGEGNRRQTAAVNVAQAVIDAVVGSPGINSGHLHDALSKIESNKTRRGQAINEAKDARKIVQIKGKVVKELNLGVPVEPVPQAEYFYPMGFPGLPKDWY